MISWLQFFFWHVTVTRFCRVSFVENQGVTVGPQVFVCFEDELCKILVAHLSRPPRPDIKWLAEKGEGMGRISSRKGQNNRVKS